MKRGGERGTVLPMIAGALAVTMGFAGVGVDVGYLEYREQAQQTATDAAAAGGADALVRAGCPNDGVAQSAALVDAANNGFAASSNVTVAVQNPPSSGPFAGNICGVAVTISTSQVATFFSRLFGYPHGMGETTQATAIVTQTGGGCIYLLNPTVESNFNGDNVTATKCGVLINDTANFNGATIAAASIGYAGAPPNENGSNFTMAAPQPMLPVADPCQEISGCAYLAANPPSTAGCQSQNYNGYTGSLPSGCYSSLNLNGSHVTMSGLYVFTGSLNFNGSTLVGNGVTMYVTGSGTPPNFNGVNVSFTPMTSGSTAGVLYYQVPSNTQAPNFNGSNNSYAGLIYAPGASSVNFNGATGGYLVLVFGSANVNGSYAQDFATPPPNQSLVKQAVVAE